MTIQNFTENPNYIPPGSNNYDPIPRAPVTPPANPPAPVPPVTPPTPPGPKAPEVTPTPTPATPVPSPSTQPTPEAGYLPRASTEGPAPAPVAYKDLLGTSQKLIDAINKSASDKMAQARAATSGILAAGGLGGSSAGEAATSAAIAPILDQRELDLQTAYKNIDTQDRANATDSIKALATNHMDWNAYKNTNPKNYQKLVNTFGGDPNVVDAMFANSIPKGDVQQTWVNGSTYNQLVTDPVTGKPSIQTYDLGVKIPQNWTMDKIGTNAVVYHGPNWDPHDPSTYQIFGIDPLTGLPTGQVGGAPNSSISGATGDGSLGSAIASVESGNDYASIGRVIETGENAGYSALGKYQIMPNLWFSSIGLDPTSEEDKQRFLNTPELQDKLFTQITDGLLKRYNGDQSKAIAAYFAGDKGAQAYGTPAGDKISDGNMTVNQYVDKVMGNLATGGQQTPQTVNDILSVAGISLPVFNYLTQGTSSMSRMSAAQRNQIMTQATEFLKSKNVDPSTFQSQYKAYNDVLASNIQRNAKTKIMESELLGTTDNLLSVVKDADLKKINAKNVLKVWAGKQTNDKLATQYAFHFQQLKNELAGYFAASQGKASPDVIDNTDAENAVVNGMATGSLEGFRKSVENSTSKMGSVLKGSIDSANKAVWDLFGVGDKYKGKEDAKTYTIDNADTAPVGSTISIGGVNYKKVGPDSYETL